MNRTTWLNKLKPKNLVTLYNGSTRQKINIIIFRIDQENIILNNGITVNKTTGHSIDQLHTIEPLR